MMGKMVILEVEKIVGFFGFLANGTNHPFPF